MKKSWMKVWAVFLCFIIGMTAVVPDKETKVQAATPWYRYTRRIVHACGSINGKKYTNSKEALSKSLRKGKKLIEVDFLFSKDGTLVCRHDWNGSRPTVESFLKWKLSGRYTPMTAKDALTMIGSRKNVYLIVDTKERSSARVYRNLVNICRSMGRNDLIKRIVVQIYSQSGYKSIRNVYGFSHWLFTVYKYKSFSKKRCQSIAKFCKKRKIPVVTIPTKWATKRNSKILRKYNRVTFVHTVNSNKTYKKYRKKKFTGVYSDYLL